MLCVNKYTPNNMVYGELGRTPLSIDIKTRVITYWAKIVLAHNSKLTNNIYNLLYYQFVHNNCNILWLNYVKSILKECGLNQIWLTHNFYSVNWLKCHVNKLYLINFYKNGSYLQNSPLFINYRLYKNTLDLEPYLLNLTCKNAKLFCRMLNFLLMLVDIIMFLEMKENLFYAIQTK